MLKSRILDGRGTNRALSIDQAGAALFLEEPIPPYGGSQKMRVFRQYLTNGGKPTDSNDMQVDGSSTNVDFWVGSHTDRDRYICVLSFAIADSAAQLNEFGAITALTNGCRLFYTDERGEVDIHDALKSNFNFVRLAQGQPAFVGGGGGGGTIEFRAQNVTGTSEGYIPSVDLRHLFGFRWGVRISHGTTQRLTLRVRDNTTGVDGFDCIAYGFERLPD